MNRFERVLMILLLLRNGKTLSAKALAKRFDVSVRTVHRDLDMLNALGVPLYAEMGRHGGFRLVEGYFLPPIMFSTQEATTLLMGLLLMRRLRVTPFVIDLETAEQKLLTAMPDHLREVVTNLKDVIGFEAVPIDMFTAEHRDSGAPLPEVDEGEVLSVFVRAILGRKMIAIQYYSPYRRENRSYSAVPQGLLWDRDRWYLVGRSEQDNQVRMWRADRVLNIRPEFNRLKDDSQFQISSLLSRKWLQEAMQDWIDESPVVIRLSGEQANRLKQDWYYGYARYEATQDGHVLMTYGEDNQRFVFDLLRWLGPGAELIEPRGWRTALRDELRTMLDAYIDG
jgi:predicted DNA-binding transcriptional regulator YafY